MRNSPYLVLPVIGPTNVRDLLGTTVELAAPTFATAIPSVANAAGNLLSTNVATAANNVTVAGSVASPFTKLDQVQQMAELEDSSIDFYSMLRSVVSQKRQAELMRRFKRAAGRAGRLGNSNGRLDRPIVPPGRTFRPSSRTLGQRFYAPMTRAHLLWFPRFLLFVLALHCRLPACCPHGEATDPAAARVASLRCAAGR
jgi:hypothetical protein